MGTFSIWHWLIVLAVVLLLFGGRGKISSILGDVGKGIKSFKKGISEEEAQTKEDADTNANANAKVTEEKDKATSS